MNSSNTPVSLDATRLSALVFALSAMLAVIFFTMPQSTLAASECQKVKAVESSVNNGDGTLSGRISKGGRLNGTTQVMVTGPFTPTPDPHTFSFTDDFTLTTYDGVLKTHNVSLINFTDGVGSAFAIVDPNMSGGAFAGSTGVLYFNFKTADGVNIQAEISGDLCFAN